MFCIISLGWILESVKSLLQAFKSPIQALARAWMQFSYIIGYIFLSNFTDDSLRGYELIILQTGFMASLNDSWGLIQALVKTI